MNWRDAVIAAIGRYRMRHGTRIIERQRLVDEELEQINADTDTRGKTPAQTVSRVLQDLRSEGVIEFRTAGTYLFLGSLLLLDEEDLPDDVIDEAIFQNKLIVGSVPTGDEQVLSRRRRGQQRLRELTLRNYGYECAVCDTSDVRLLVASHVVRWADDEEERGNLANLICLCRFHDVLFENGYLSFRDDYSVLKKVTAGSNVVRQVLDMTTALRPPVAYLPPARFLKRHRERLGFLDCE